MSREKIIEPRSVAFREKREMVWQELEELVNKAEKKGLSGLDEQELQRLPILYRETLSSLSVARSTAIDRTLLLYLEALSSRAYIVVYGARRPLRDLWNVVWLAIPRAVRQIRYELLFSVLLFALGVWIAWTLTLQDPAWFNSFVPRGLANGRNPWAKTEVLRETLYSSPNFKESLSVFASHLFAHNTRIGILAFSLGFFLGIPTALLIFVNGLILGAFLAMFHEHGLLIQALGWLLPHGVPEIMAILLCGAGGLALGRAILFPGKLKRMDALRHIGPQTALVVTGCLLLFAIAAFFEGFLRQLIQHDLSRYLMASFHIIWLSAWLLLAGRREDQEFRQALRILQGEAASHNIR